MEKTGCKIICGAPTTLAVNGLMMMMMMLCSDCLGLFSAWRAVRACLRGVDLFLFGGRLCCFCLRSFEFPTVSNHVCVAERFPFLLFVVDFECGLSVMCVELCVWFYCLLRYLCGCAISVLLV